jgi:hypothetical protein
VIGWLTPLSTCGAFWLALWLHQRRGHEGTAGFAAALATGAVAAHLGWLLLFQQAPLARAPLGFSLLFLPMGLVASCRQPAALACLPLPLALARLGCLAAGCCHGAAGERLPLFEVLGLGSLHFALQALPQPVRPGAFLLGFGVLRLAQEPLRPTPEAALLAPAAVALCWVALGALWCARSATSR